MSVRKWIDNNSAVVTIAAVTILGLAMAFMFLPAGGAQGVRKAYYYDPETDEIFVAEASLLSPIETPAGNSTGLRSYVFACGDCPANLAGRRAADLERTDAFIGYLHRYPTGAIELMQRQRAGETLSEQEQMQLHQLQMSEFIRAPDQSEWTSLDSAAGTQIIEAVRRRCEGEGRPLTECHP